MPSKSILEAASAENTLLVLVMLHTVIGAAEHHSMAALSSLILLEVAMSGSLGQHCTAGKV